ncbi:Cation/H(+) antiporter 15 [Triticum urartu]|uniref:Cation/H(+) antiporter 15 n=1 Tax=Triticum urartu TaxID=4572 RepID=M8AF67_TRIUA|nr:Cation/H(+) antiporter 15 [Triticum urartu]
MSLAGEVAVNRSLYCLEPNSRPTSSGVFAGDDPLKFYFPLLLYHICIIFILSQAMYAVFRRVGIPLVISQILAGALLGPSFLGHYLPHVGEIFATPRGWVQINTVGGYAFTLHIFTIGVKTDLGMIVKSGKKAIAIAVLGTAAPHLAMYVTALALSDRIPKQWTDTFLLTNLNSWWSLSAFIVVCCTLDDLHLLSSKLGRLAMSAALIGDFANTFAIAGVTSYLLQASPEEKLQRIGFASSLSFTIFIALMGLVARPVILRLIRDVPEGGILSESRLVAVLLISITCSFAGELLGLHATYGPFMLGLMLPGGAPLGVTLAERLDRLVAGVLTPLLIAQGGMRMNVHMVTDASTCGLLEVFLVVGILAKFVACMVPCLYCQIPVRESVAVGLMMNFKGITEVVYASAFMDSKVLDDEAYAAFMMNVLVVGAATGAAVKYMYHPEENEHLELGVLGDLLTSADFGSRLSTLVVQQQTRAAAGKAKTAVNQKGLQGGAAGNQAMQRALGDADKFKPELLKQGKVNPLDGAVGEVGTSDGDNTEGAERQRWRHRDARIWVRAPSLVGRSEMISPRTASGRSLMVSSAGDRDKTEKPHEGNKSSNFEAHNLAKHALTLQINCDFGIFVTSSTGHLDTTKDPDSEEDKLGKGKKNGSAKGQQHNPAGHGNNGKRKADNSLDFVANTNTQENGQRHKGFIVEVFHPEWRGRLSVCWFIRVLALKGQVVRGGFRMKALWFTSLGGEGGEEGGASRLSRGQGYAEGGR